MNNIIKIDSLKKSFGVLNAVDDVNFTVNKGEMLGIVGPDGAGKTTLIRILCGIIKPDSGGGHIMGYDLLKDRNQVKNHIGYLSQKFSLYEDLTVDENIEFFAGIHQVKNFNKRRDELLVMTRLIDFRNRLAGRLSGGMKQKLALVCTLIYKPDIIFLDEPTAGVDPVSRRDFWRILFTLLKDGMTIILTTAYLDEAERCSKIGMMHKGKFLVLDTFTSIKKLMKGIIYEIVCTKIREAYKILLKHSFIREIQSFGDRLNVVLDKKDAGEKIKEILRNNDIEILHIREISPSLENVFISLLKIKDNME